MTPAQDPRAIDVMRQEIATIPGVIADQVRELRPRLREIAERSDPGLADVVLTGCGDSHFVGLAARLAFERYAGVRCRPSEALELTRYEIRYVPTRPAAPLLVAVSYSGEVGRTIEAAASAADFGWRTIALTGRSDGRLAGVVDDAVLMSIPTLGSSPGTSTYVGMLAALFVLAAELARARGRAREADVLDGAIAAAPELAARTLAAADAPAEELADLLAGAPVSTFLGAGPSRATAAFGAAKLFEGPQRHGVAQDLEEWAHEQYFVSGPTTPIVVVAPAGPSRDRAGELLAEMAFIKAPTALVSDVGDDRVARSASVFIPVAPGLDEALSPLLTCLPLALGAFFLSKSLGTRSYGFTSPEQEREHYQTIHRATRARPA